MAAPIDTKYPLSKKILKSIFAGNILSSLVILGIIYFPFSRKTTFDIVYNSLTVTKLMSAFLWVLNLTLSFVLKAATDKSQERAKIFAGIKKGILMYIGSILLAYLIIILYGAPLTESVSETWHLSLLLSTAAVAPGLIHLGVHTDQWTRVFAMNCPETAMERVVQFTTLSSIVGGWLGAVPIPLDWDRPWQVWPITCVIGTLLGYVAGLLASTAYLGYQYYRLSKIKTT